MAEDLLPAFVPSGHVGLDRLQMRLRLNLRPLFRMEDGASFRPFGLLVFRWPLTECGYGIWDQTGSWDERYFFPRNLSFLEQGKFSFTVRPNSRQGLVIANCKVDFPILSS